MSDESSAARALADARMAYHPSELPEHLKAAIGEARVVLWDVLVHMRPDHHRTFRNVYDVARVANSILYWRDQPFVELSGEDGQPVAVLCKADIIAIDWERVDASASSPAQQDSSHD
jgi:hypothetical protein